MLEKLNDIDWKSRNAEDVPIWLQNLSSSDDKIRINAQQQLDETVVRITDQNHDSGRGISTILITNVPLLIVPFLIELLTNETTPDKARIIEMLIGMMGYVEMQDEGIEFKNRAWQIYEEIWKGFDTYLALLIHHDSLLRSESVTLLCFFGKYSKIVLPHIQKTMLEEQNADAKQWMTKMFRIRFPNEELPQ